MEAPPTSTLLNAVDCFPSELLHLFDIVEGCIVPKSKALDGFLKHSWYWLPTNAEPLLGEPAFDDGDAVGLARFDYHSSPVDATLKLIHQVFGS